MASTAELAGVMGSQAHRRPDPPLPPLALTRVAVTVTPELALPGFHIRAEVRTHGPTGVEMEALTAVAVAGVTLFDMLKAIDRTMVIGAVRVTSKSGGRGGDRGEGALE